MLFVKLIAVCSRCPAREEFEVDVEFDPSLLRLSLSDKPAPSDWSWHRRHNVEELLCNGCYEASEYFLTEPGR